MTRTRLLGPPPAAVVVSGVAIVAAALGLLLSPGPVSIVFGALAALLAWRLLGLAVHLEGQELVVRNTLNTYRFPVTHVDIRARVVDPRLEHYTPGDPAGYPEIPTAGGDNTVQTAKWYGLEHGKDRYYIDALWGRSPANHERLAFELRQEILNTGGASSNP